MNSSQAQTTWLILIFAGIIGCLAFGVVGISSAESMAATRLADVATSAPEIGETRAGFLGWGAVCAFVALGSMRFVRHTSSEEGASSRATGERRK